MSRLKEVVRSLHATPHPVGLFIPFGRAWWRSRNSWSSRARRAQYRDHSAVANLVPKIKPAGAGRSGVTIKTDGEEIGSNSPGPSGFQAARAKSRRAIWPWSIFRRSGCRFGAENATKQKAKAPLRPTSLSCWIGAPLEKQKLVPTLRTAH